MRIKEAPTPSLGENEDNEFFEFFLIDANFPKTQSPFGIRYRFMLKDAVNDCDEFLVIPDVLRRCALVALYFEMFLRHP